MVHVGDIMSTVGENLFLSEYPTVLKQSQNSTEFFFKLQSYVNIKYLLQQHTKLV